MPQFKKNKFQKIAAKKQPITVPLQFSEVELMWALVNLHAVGHLFL
jgi:hypothetical protein